MLQQQALFFLLQCLPAKALADPAVKASVIDNLSGLPASFTDLAPQPAVLAGQVLLNDDKGGAAITLDLLAGQELLKSFDLNKALVSASYNLQKGNEANARYQWQRFWAAVNFLQFLPVFYAWTPDSRNSGIAAGLIWGQPSTTSDKTEPERDQTPAWYDKLEDDLKREFDQHDMNWPAEASVATEITSGELDEVVGEAELLFEEQKIALLLLDIEDQAAARPYLEVEGWRISTSVEELVEALNELDSGA